MYIGKTTLMEPKGQTQDGVPLFQSQMMGTMLDPQLQLSNLGNIATSQKVLSNAAQSLAELGLKMDPEDILAATSVHPERDTNILAIEVTLPDEQEAKVAADAIATEFKKTYDELNNQALKDSRNFIEGQINSTRNAMVKAQDALRRYKEQNGVVEINQQLADSVQNLYLAQTNANQAQINHEAAASRAMKAATELAKLPESQIAGTSISRNPIWERLSESLTDLETKKAAMLNGVPGQPRRGPNHPEVVALQAQINDVKDQLSKTKSDYIASTQQAKNPVWQTAYGNWFQAKVEDVATGAQAAAAENVIKKMKSEMSQLPAKEAELAKLQVDLKAATDTYSLMKSKLDEAKIRENQGSSEVALRTIDPAHVTEAHNNGLLKLALALVLAPLMGIGVAFLLHYTDNTVKTAADAEKLLGLPVLTAIPGSKAHSLPRQHCPEIMDVAYQMLTSNLWVATQNQADNGIVMVSAEPDAGRSVNASNLAVALAREGAKVILVDADLRKPTQHLIFGVDNKVGLTNVLSGGATLEDALALTRVQGLLLIPAGPVPDNPVKLLRSPEMKEFVDQVKEFADFVVFDTPAGVTFPDPVLVASQVGSAVVVHSAGRVPRGSEAELRQRLESIGVRLIGAVLNKVRREDSSSFFHYHRSYEGVVMPQLTSGKKAIKSGPRDQA